MFQISQSILMAALNLECKLAQIIMKHQLLKVPQFKLQSTAPLNSLASRMHQAEVCSHSGCLCGEFKFNPRRARVRFGTECVHRLCVVCLWLRLVCLQAQTKAIDCAGRASLCAVGQRVIAAQQQARDFVRECIVSSAINHRPRRHVHSPSARSQLFRPCRAVGDTRAPTPHSRPRIYIKGGRIPSAKSVCNYAVCTPVMEPRRLMT